MAQVNEQDIELSRWLVDEIADPWTIRILWALCPGTEPVRFNEIKRRVGRISQKTLTQCLRRLERNGMLQRTVIAAKPLGVQYAVTPLGQSLEDPIATLLTWAEKHVPEVRRAQASYDRKPK